MTERQPVCIGSGQRAFRPVYWLGKTRCPHCGAHVYTTMRDGKLYKHRRAA